MLKCYKSSFNEFFSTLLRIEFMNNESKMDIHWKAIQRVRNPGINLIKESILCITKAIRL